MKCFRGVVLALAVGLTMSLRKLSKVDLYVWKPSLNILKFCRI